MYKLKLSTKLILTGIIFLAAFFRFYNLNWDQGHHLHPDERAIVMTVVKLQFPQSISTFFSSESTWNPHFFAYGSLPFYLLKISGEALAAFNPLIAGYDLLNITGRFISAVFDIATILLLFFLGRRLKGTSVGLFAAFFYSVGVLPIQLSHFYAVDTLLTFFILATLYRLIIFYKKPSLSNSFLVGIFFGLAFAIKVSAVVLLVPLLTALSADFVVNFIRHLRNRRVPLEHIDLFVKHFLSRGLLFFMSALATYAVCEPYAFIDFKEFWRQTLEQSQMTHNAFIFPYTLQYVWKTPYFYEIKNVFFWGLGPILGSLVFAGTIYIFYQTLSRTKFEKRIQYMIVGIFFVAYFWLIGRFSIGFMRYMLPLYPILCLYAGYFSLKLIKWFNGIIKNNTLAYIFYFVCFISILIWPISFTHIYNAPNTRTTATEWINNYIPAGKVLAQEHWDDGIPMYGGEKYRFVSLPLYDEDTPEKWQNINDLLSQTDYIIIASNRLYTPLQRLTDCEKLPPGKCYTLTAEYYKKLFSGDLNFQKIVEFSVFPSIPFFNININDQAADESFTVYDHPKVMIFQKVNPNRGN